MGNNKVVSVNRMEVGREHSVALDVGFCLDKRAKRKLCSDEQRVEIFVHPEVATWSNKKSPEVAE